MMKVAYFDCMSGISGDMTLSALLDVGARLESVQDAVESMGLSGVRLEVGSTARKGFRGLLLGGKHLAARVSTPEDILSNASNA